LFHTNQSPHENIHVEYTAFSGAMQVVVENSSVYRYNKKDKKKRKRSKK
jgi:hypothetical protein